MICKNIIRNVGTIDKVKAFVNANCKFDGSVTVVSGRYIIDGKSVMGMFSLDLTHEVEIKIEHDSEEAIDELIRLYDSVGI